MTNTEKKNGKWKMHTVKRYLSLTLYLQISVSSEIDR